MIFGTNCGNEVLSLQLFRILPIFGFKTALPIAIDTYTVNSISITVSRFFTKLTPLEKSVYKRPRLVLSEARACTKTSLSLPFINHPRDLCARPNGCSYMILWSWYRIECYSMNTCFNFHQAQWRTEGVRRAALPEGTSFWRKTKKKEKKNRTTSPRKRKRTRQY